MKNNVDFNLGEYQLHANPNFNYQLNRTYNVSNGNLDEILELAKKITDIKAWEKEMMALAEKDHLIRIEKYKDAIDSLKNVKSLTYRMFTEKENAASHCNTGNPKLVLDTIISWIKIIKNREE
ncbi:hypothetical protein [Clostridium scatologenes]|nr:hypothetical protein [Clostridium scatologenes]